MKLIFRVLSDNVKSLIISKKKLKTYGEFSTNFHRIFMEVHVVFFFSGEVRGKGGLSGTLIR